MSKIKKSHVWMPIDWKLNNELTRYDIPQSDLYFCYGSQKTEFLWRKKDSDFRQKYEIPILVKNATFFIMNNKTYFLPPWFPKYSNAFFHFSSVQIYP